MADGGSASAAVAFDGGGGGGGAVAGGEAVSVGGWVVPGRARAAVAAVGGFVPARIGGGAPEGGLLVRENWGE